jgi:uncharacterized membrane protein YraQ (UPF0718 family)
MGDTMKQLLKRYKGFLFLLAVNLGLLLLFPVIGVTSFRMTGQNLLEMLAILPPIFILLGLLDVWVPRETMIKMMGAGSGLRGAALAFLLGSAAAGPLYAAFPIAVVLLKKGAALRYVLIFIGAWSTTKIPMLLFELGSMGWQFTLARFLVNLVGIGGIAFLTEKVMKQPEKEAMKIRLQTEDGA